MTPETTYLVEQFKHDRPLTSCHWDPLDRYVFFGAEDNYVHRYGLADKTLTPFAAHNSWVRAMAVTPDGAWLVTGGYDGRLCWWSAAAEKPEPVRVIEDAHQGWIRALAISPDGALVATCGNDRLVKVWNAADGKLERVFKGHESHVYNVCFAPDGQSLVSCDLKAVVRGWGLAGAESDREITRIEDLYKYDTTFRADIGGARCMAFRPDGSQLALGGITNVTNAFAGVGEIAIAVLDWELSKVSLLLQAKDKIRGIAWGIAYHSAGTWIGLSGGGGGGWLYYWKGDVADEAFKFKLTNDGRGMSLAPHQQRLAVAHADSHLRIYGWQDSIAG